MPGVGCLFRPSPGRGLLVGSGQPEGRRRWLVVCSYNTLSLIQVEVRGYRPRPFGHIGRVAGLNLDHLGWGLGCPWQQVLLFWFVLSCSITSCLVLALVLGFDVFGVRLLAWWAGYLW